MILKENILFIRTREMLDGYENYQDVQYLLKKGQCSDSLLALKVKPSHKFRENKFKS